MNRTIIEYCKKKRISESELARMFGVSRNVIYDSKKAGYEVSEGKGKLRLVKVKLEVDL